jgi:hypothetical protein
MSSNSTTTFDIDRQSGQSISNVGGDQTIYYGDRSRATRAGKVLASLGLVLLLVGLALLVVMSVVTAHNVLHVISNGDAKPPYTKYVPAFWPLTVGLLVGGVVVNRVARIVVGR